MHLRRINAVNFWGMKNLHRLSFVAFLLLTNTLLTNCSKEILVNEPVTPEISVIPASVKDASVANKFIWNDMHDYYLWVDQVPNLSASKFSSKDTLNAFLNKYPDPEKLFYDLLYKYQSVDKWSFIAKDSTTIQNWLAGVSKTTGYDFMLARIGSTNNLFGFVRYVVKGSPADLAGIRRGDIFLKVDDQQLTISNYQALLFTNESYKLTFAAITNNVISATNRSISLTAVSLQENPILMDTVLVVNGAKVGSLVYNGFSADFDLKLNDAFKNFKNEGISKLILDLRYNGGGSIQTAIYLASMIYGTFTTKDFIKSQYNPTLQSYFLRTYGETSLLDNFADNIAKTASAPLTPINTVNVSKLYVIATDNTASASELLINGLRPYMSVTHVGSTTVGKYVGSITLQDLDAQGNVDPKDTWTMQPIVVKISNSLGVTDYVNGLTPDIKAQEDIANLAAFGNPNETLLKAVLNDIQGLPQKSLTLKSATLGLNKFADAKDFKRYSNDMYIHLKHAKPLNLPAVN